MEKGDEGIKFQSVIEKSYRYRPRPPAFLLSQDDDVLILDFIPKPTITDRVAIMRFFADAMQAFFVELIFEQLGDIALGAFEDAKVGSVHTIYPLSLRERALDRMSQCREGHGWPRAA